MATVGVHLTYFAPNCADLRFDDPKLWQWLCDQSAETVWAWLRERLERPIKAMGLGQEGEQVIIYGLQLTHKSAGTENPRVILAILFDGVTFDDMRLARDRLLNLTPGKAA